MLRTNHGCWSCRVRRQKCDETKPFCMTCTSRSITCHGYGRKPSWMDGNNQQRTVANNLKRQIADNRKRKRKDGDSLNLGSLQVASQESQEVSLASNGENVDTVMSRIKNATSSNSTGEHCQLLTRRPSIGLGRLTTYREAELIMHYMDAVFPLQFRFHVPDARGRGWLLWLLVQSGPLYHAAMSLSALHQSIYMPMQFQSSYGELAAYHAQALSDLRQFLQNIQEDSTKDERSRKIELLSCGVSLISFELFQGGISDWQLHLNALISILFNENTSSVMDLLRESTQNANDENASPAWQGTALSFFVTVILWFDLLSCASTNCPPRMPYRELLDNHLVDMSTTMGVQNTVMWAIGDIASLNARKDLEQPSTENDILTECHQIENSLREVLDALCVPGQSDNVCHVTRVFATAALVQLSTIISDYKSETLSVYAMVEQNISAIKHISNPQHIRGLIWPICISGSMASTSYQQEFYEKTLRSTLNGASRDFGNCATLLDILRWSWNSRRERNATPRKDWRHAMAEIGTCLLV